MLTLTKAFGGLNNRLEPHLLEPSKAQDLSNVNLDSLGLKPLKGPGATVTSGVGTMRSIHKFSGNWLKDTIAWQYVEYGGILYRAAAGQNPQKSADGVTWYALSIPAPPQATVADGGAGVITGTYQYYVTYLSALGGESPPSPVSASLTVAGRQIAVGVTASTDPQVTGLRLYRSGGSQTATARIGGDRPNTTGTITDNTTDAQIGPVLTTSEHGAVPQLEGLAVTPYGTMVGWVGRNLYAAEQAAPWAWPTLSVVPLPETIRAVVSFPGALLVLTVAAPYVLHGSNVSNFQLQNVPSQQGCLGRDTAVDMGDQGVMWASPDGLCRFDGQGVTVVSKSALSNEFMAGVNPTNAKACRFNERYMLFHPDSASPGFIEFDPRTEGGWKKGTVTANAVHYNRTDDALYLAQGADVKQWEAGTSLEFQYWTGDWAGEEAAATVKHFKEFAVHHDGTVWAEVYVDGQLRGSRQTFTRSSLGHSLMLVPMGSWGHRVSMKVGGTGRVVELLTDPVDMGEL
jgi:hypothetical protein